MSELERLADLYDVTIKRMSLPGKKGLAHKNGEGYLIIINHNLCEEKSIKTLTHEFLHITLGHLDERIDISRDQKEEEVSAALKAMGY